jgi:sugar lactone lactonase YvrE
MCLDRAGNLYVPGIQGVELFERTQGKRYDAYVRVNAAPDDAYGLPTNCAFGGADGKTLYVTRPELLMKARVNVPGLPN